MLLECELISLPRSVDGIVRRYDIRFGKLFSDTIGCKFEYPFALYT